MEWNFSNSWKIPKKDKKMHSRFHCIQINESWLKMGGINFDSPVHRGEGGKIFEFLENSEKHLCGRTIGRRITNFLVIR